MKLTVSADGRSLCRDGAPFFYLGDTAWFLFTKLTRREAEAYLDNRALKGFTVIQATLVQEMDYADPLGRKALIDNDFARPDMDSGYWEGVLHLVRYAASRGLVMALLPSWGSFASSGLLNAGNAPIYAQHLASVFGAEDNILWLLGGDVRGDAAPDTFCTLGRALKSLCPDKLVGFHPFGRCDSSFWFHNEPWLDFNMFQSGHRDYGQRILREWDDNAIFYGEDNYRYALADRELSPAKPTLDGEPSYERIPHGLHDPSQPYWRAEDVRRYAYWSLLSGSCGHTYGDNAVMQFHREGDEGAFGVKETWDIAIHDPASGQMMHARRLLEWADFPSGRPCHEIFVDPQGERHAYHPALLTDKALLVYEYERQPLRLKTEVLPFSDLYALWFDPVSGAFSPISPVEPSACSEFLPPDRQEEVSDWVLCLCDAHTLSDICR